MNELIIDIDDLVHNINVIRSKEDSNYTIIAVVKGNAYGLDLKQYVEILKDMDIEYFAVSSYQEALEFRKYFTDKLLVMTPYSEESIVSDLIDLDVILTIDSIKQSKLIDKIAKEKNKKVYSHIKVDTGLNRYGFKYNDVISIINTINNTQNIKYYGIYSHFSTSLKKSPKYTQIQYNRFIKVIEELQNNNIEFKLKHICNSSAYFKYPDMHLNASRIGSAFLGQAVGIKTDLKLIGTFHTHIVKIIDIKKGEYVGYANSFKSKNNMTLAILPTGYFDGIGKSLLDQRYTFKSKIKGLYISFIKLFKNDYYKINDLNIIGQIGMHDIVIDITDKNYKINDDIYFYVRPIFIDSSIKRIYRQKTNEKI